MRYRYIYKITNLINGKAYIGQHDGSKGHYYASGAALKNAVKKYGKNSFNREILVKGLFNAELLDLLEQEAIEKHQTFAPKYPNKGYNLTVGGGGRLGSTQSKESIQKIRDNAPSKSVNQFTKCGKFIKSYHSISEARRQTGVLVSTICRCTSGESITGGGFLWSFNKIVEPIEIHKPTIFCYDLAGEFVKDYLSMGEAARELNVHYTGISNAIKSKGQSAGFQWRKEKFESIPEYTVKELAFKVIAKKHCKAIDMLDRQGNFIKKFNSILEASAFIKRCPGGFKDVMSGRNSHWAGYKWRYSEGFSKRTNSKTHDARKGANQKNEKYKK